MKHYILGLAALALLLGGVGQVRAGFMLPPGLKPGQTFQIIFVTTDGIAASDDKIKTYNDFVTMQAAPITKILMGLGYKNITWSAIASTAKVQASVNAPQGFSRKMNGDRVYFNVYDTRGNVVADDNRRLYASLSIFPWLGLHSPPQFNQMGNLLTTSVWTGSDINGFREKDFTMGSKTVVNGISNVTDKRWLEGGGASNDKPLSLYGLSEPLTVPGVPEPSSLTLLGLGCLGLLGYGWRRRKQAVS
jgi:hypothetical protein